MNMRDFPKPPKVRLATVSGTRSFRGVRHRGCSSEWSPAEIHSKASVSTRKSVRNCRFDHSKDAALGEFPCRRQP